jgi:hypothetical protein
MGASASVVSKEEVEKLPQYTILGGWSEYNIMSGMHNDRRKLLQADFFL